MVKFGCQLLLHISSCVPEAQVKLPTPAEVASFKEAVSKKYLSCPNFWGAVNMLKLMIEMSLNYEKHRRFYNECTHGHYISCAFAFSVDEKIRRIVLNAPRNFHNSNLTNYVLYEPMEYTTVRVVKLLLIVRSG